MWKVSCKRKKKDQEDGSLYVGTKRSVQNKKPRLEKEDTAKESLIKTIALATSVVVEDVVPLTRVRPKELVAEPVREETKVSEVEATIVQDVANASKTAVVEPETMEPVLEESKESSSEEEGINEAVEKKVEDVVKKAQERITNVKESTEEEDEESESETGREKGESEKEKSYKEVVVESVAADKSASWKKRLKMLVVIRRKVW